MGELAKKNDLTNIEKYKATFNLKVIRSHDLHNNDLRLLEHEVYFRENYMCRFNEVSTEYEVLKGEIDEVTGSEVYKWELLPQVELLNDLKRAGISNKKLTENDVKNMMEDRRLVPAYNPLNEYFKTVTYDGGDHIDNYASYLKVEGGEEENLRWRSNFKKSLVRTVKCAVNDLYFNKHCIVLYSADQSVGKTSYLRTLCPPILSDYFSEESISNDKDSQIMLAKNFIVLLDELASLSRLDINYLKGILSKREVNLRLPYASKTTRMPRRCSFFGTTNRTDFLMDSQNVRWLVFPVDDIDKSYGNIFTGEYNIDVDQIWAEAYHLYLTGYPCELNRVDLEQNELNNSLYSATSLERELIEQYFEPASVDDEFKNGYYKMQGSDIYELLCDLLRADGREETANKINHIKFFLEFKSIAGWKKVGLRLNDRRVTGYHFFVRKEKSGDNDKQQTIF
jgi:predicted P-loop ATPase